MFCYNCGKEIDDSANFCPHCRAAIKTDEVSQVAAIMDRFKNGDPTAFEDLHAATEQKIRGFISEAGLSGPNAEDAVQGVYLKILQSVDELENSREALNWIQNITATTVKNFKKAKTKAAEDSDKEKAEDQKKYQIVAAIMDRMKSGDPTAFDDLYAETQQMVRSSVKAIGLNEQDAEDVMQEVYVKLYKSMDSIADSMTTIKWLKTTTRNAAIDYLRKNKKATVTKEDDDDYIFDNLEETDTMALPEDAMTNKDTQRILGEMLDELPPMQKTVMIKYFFNQMKIREIAQELEISEGTVKSYKAKATNAMKEKVLALQKKTGVTLRTMPLAPFMLLIIRQHLQNAAAAAAVGAAAHSATSGTAQTTAGATAGTAAKATVGSTAKAAAGTAAKVTAVKAVAGVAAVAVVGTGVAYGVNSHRNVPVDPQAVVATLDDFSTACRELDNEGILDCLSEESREIMQSYDMTQEYARPDEAGTTIDDQCRFELVNTEVDSNRKGDEVSVYCEYVQYDYTADNQKTNERTVATGYIGMVKEHGKWKIQLCRQNENIFQKGSKTSNMRFPELIKNELVYNDEIE